MSSRCIKLLTATQPKPFHRKKSHETPKISPALPSQSRQAARACRCCIWHCLGLHHRHRLGRLPVLWVVGMRVKDMTTTDLPDLEAQLQHALDQARGMSLPAHAVRNCPSDLQGRDQAWRKVQNLQYQINCIKNDRPIY